MRTAELQPQSALPGPSCKGGDREKNEWLTQVPISPQKITTPIPTKKKKKTAARVVRHQNEQRENSVPTRDRVRVVNTVVSEQTARGGRGLGRGRSNPFLCLPHCPSTCCQQRRRLSRCCPCSRLDGVVLAIHRSEVHISSLLELRYVRCIF